MKPEEACTELSEIKALYTKKELKVLQEKYKTDMKDCAAAVKFFELKDKENKTAKTYMEILNLIDYKGFVCYYYDDYIEILQEAPDEIKEIIKMKKEMEQNNYKKAIYRKILHKEKD